jgi:hypothetical protein
MGELREKLKDNKPTQSDASFAVEIFHGKVRG